MISTQMFASRYVDEQNLRMFRGALRAAVQDRYDKLTDLNYFDTVSSKFRMASPTPQQEDMVEFFRHLHTRIDGSQGLAEGVRTHFITTNYDYVIETILDSVLGDDDSHFLYTYRGFTRLRSSASATCRPSTSIGSCSTCSRSTGALRYSVGEMGMPSTTAVARRRGS